MANYPSTQNTDDNLYLAVNNLSTVLTDDPLLVGATTVNVSDASNFPSVGILTIDLEAIHYTGKTATSFTGCTRGFDGTTAVQHSVGATVFHDIPAAHHNVLKDEIKAISDDLRDTFTADLDDSATVAATATDVKERLDQIVTQVKNISGETDWKTTPAESLSTLETSKAEDSAVVHLAGTETITGEKTFSSKILAQDGSAANPAVTFSSDQDTGLYKAGPNSVGLSVGGASKLSLTTSFTSVQSGQIDAPDGSASNPTYSFSNDTTTGIYHGTGNVSVSTGGTLRADFSSAGLDMHSNKITSLATPTTSGDAARYDEISVLRKNVLNQVPNGGMNVWQRATSFSSPANGAYVADCWRIEKVVATPTYTISRESTIKETGPYSMKVDITVGSAGVLRIYSILERRGIDYSGDVTITARIRSNASNAVRVGLFNGATSFSPYHSGGSTFETLTTTQTWTTGSDNRIWIIVEPDVVQTTYIDSVMVTLGDQSILYVPEDPSVELTRCQRYYQKVGGQIATTYITTAQAYNATTVYGIVNLPVEMNGTPTVTFVNPTGASVWSANGVTNAVTVANTGLPHPKGCNLDLTIGSAALVAGNAANVFFGASTTYLEFQV